MLRNRQGVMRDPELNFSEITLTIVYSAYLAATLATLPS